MLQNEIEELEEIFYSEAPYDYALSIIDRKSKYVHGACFYDEKMCAIFGPDTYDEALFTMLHEIAHARIQHKTHSDVWEKEFVYLLGKYKVSAKTVKNMRTIHGPNVREYVERVEA